jgi:hypothetical protein
MVLNDTHNASSVAALTTAIASSPKKIPVLHNRQSAFLSRKRDTGNLQFR